MARTAKAKANIKQRCKKQTCLQCNAPAVQGKRGLCDYHYSQFDNARRKYKKNDRVRFDNEQVASGNVLTSRRGRTPRQPNPFIKTA